LATVYGTDAVFMDVDDIPHGVDFVDYVESILSTVGLMVVLIGPSWTTIQDRKGRRKLERPDDLVRGEIAAALKRKIPIIPVLVEDATMPDSDEVPEDIRGLTRRNAIELTHRRWNSDVERVLSAVKSLMLLSLQSQSDNREQANERVVSLAWAHQNLSTLRVTNGLLETIRDVEVIVRGIDFDVDGHWVDSADLDRRFFQTPRRIGMKSGEVKPKRHHDVVFMQTEGRVRLQVAGTEIAKEQKLTQFGRRLLKLTVRWAPDQSRDFDCVFVLRSNGSGPEGEIRPVP
jgi:hypothetical protein